MRNSISPEQGHSSEAGRILGIDYGTRFVGLALSDPKRMIASPLRTIRVRTRKEVYREIESVVRLEEVSLVVIGLPVSLDDTEGPMAAEVRKWAAPLHSRLDVPVVFIDESLTSLQAGQMAIEVGKRKERYDHIAASLILRAYLDEVQ